MPRRGDFWSRRKAGVAEEAAHDNLRRTDAEEARDAAALEERSDEESLAELGLPDPDLMQPGDDFTAFMRHAVPERLRQRALRQLWRSDPVLANLDGLNNYDTDFTQSDIPGVAVKTSYEVGKGFLRAVLEPDADAAPPAEEAAPAVIEAPASAHAEPDEGAQRDEAIEGDEGDVPPTRRRMRFEYVG